MNDHSALLPVQGDPAAIRLRRYRNTMTVSGMGTIAFGIWSIIKTMMYFLFDPADIQKLFADTGAEQWKVFSIIIVFFLLAVDLSLRCFVGLSAAAEGKGKKRGNLYVIVAMFMTLFSIFSMVSSFIPSTYFFSMTDRIITIIVEFTSLMAMLELIISAIIVKRQTRTKQPDYRKGLR